MASDDRDIHNRKVTTERTGARSKSDMRQSRQIVERRERRERNGEEEKTDNRDEMTVRRMCRSALILQAPVS